MAVKRADRQKTKIDRQSDRQRETVDRQIRDKNRQADRQTQKDRYSCTVSHPLFSILVSSAFDIHSFQPASQITLFETTGARRWWVLCSSPVTLRELGEVRDMIGCRLFEIILQFVPNFIHSIRMDLHSFLVSQFLIFLNPQDEVPRLWNFLSIKPGQWILTLLRSSKQHKHWSEFSYFLCGSNWWGSILNIPCSGLFITVSIHWVNR